MRVHLNGYVSVKDSILFQDISIMHHFASFVLFQFLPSLILCCKSQPQKPPCPEGFWEVPEGYKCIGVSGLMTVCERNHKCMNYALLCDGNRDLEYENDTSKWVPAVWR